MNKQSQLDAAISTLTEELQKHIAQDGKKTERVFKALRAELVEKLAAHADKDGKISRRKLNTLIKEFDAVLSDARTNLFGEISSLVKGSAEQALSELDTLVFREVGQNLIAKGLHNAVIDEIIKQQVSEPGADNLLLSDRVWILTSEMHAELTKVVRSCVLKNESIGTMIAAVRAVHDNETWKIKRMVVTEANTAHRMATGAAAHKSDVVDAIKLNDSHRPHRNHASHRCYSLARADDYGLGQGVYPTSKYADLAMPHPQCTSYISYVLSDKYL